MYLKKIYNSIESFHKTTFVYNIISILSIYIVLNLFFNQITIESVGFWINSEMVSLQQGATLSSIAKLQRSFMASNVIKGALIIDENGSELLSVGKIKKYILPSDELYPYKTYIVNSGFFSVTLFIKISSGYVIVFADSLYMYAIFIFLVLYFISMQILYGFQIKKATVAIEQVKKESEFLRLNQEIESNKKISDIAKQVAHDIRSPLQALNIALTKIEIVDRNVNSLVVGAIARIKSIADELLIISKKRDVGNVSEEDTDNIVVNRSFDLVSCSHFILKQKEVEMEDRNVQFSFNSSVESAIVIGDKNIFERIVSNLINNSVEAKKDDEKSVSVVLSVRKYTSKVSLTISDNGRGIPIEIIDKIGKEDISFGKESMNGAGTGLGMSYAFRYIKLWGGNIDVVSKVNQGTMICVSLPLKI